MGIARLVFATSFCLMASSGFAQSAWQYDRDAIDGPTASVSNGAYTVGGLCMDDTVFFFVDAPRDIMPKSSNAEIAVKFVTDAPETQMNFPVFAVPIEWEWVNGYASVWFYGEVADDWIESMATAQTNVFIALETTGEAPEMITTKWFPATGSTAVLRALVAECGR